MTDLPEDDLREPANWPGDNSASLNSSEASPSPEEHPVERSSPELSPVDPNPAAPAVAEPGFEYDAPSSAEPPMFQSWAQPPIRPAARIPNFGHLCLLLLLGCIGFVCAVALIFLAMHFHLFGWELSAKSTTDIHLILASEAVLYLITFGLSLAVFPLFWKESFFAGIQWRGAVALLRFWPLAATALGCFALAALDEALMPGPSNAPIEEMLKAPGAAWLMFAFGVTIAPFFEEMFFRGFLLPALATAWDWTIEQVDRRPALPLDANGHPQWSLSAMVVASILTSLPFALMHVAQQGHSLGPFLLLIVISLILCAVRLKTRSLAASTLVHACYNFFIFSLALIGTSGFRHFDKM
jgi:hypothetical protein